MGPPCAAYSGDRPFLFVSYAHKDSELVFPELERLHGDGYRLWYDEGIEPGSEWPEEIATSLARAALFLVFISPNAVESRNVRNEINFALNNGKPFIAVYLAPTRLPPGLELRMGDIQAVLKHRLDRGTYSTKLSKVLPAAVRDSGSVARPSLRAPTEPRTAAGSTFDSLVE